MFGHRGIWADGWKAVTHHQAGQPFNDDEWELYHLDEDFSETHNLAQENPEKLRELIDLWWIEAGKQGVLPLDDRGAELFATHFQPHTPHAGRHYVYYPPVSHMPSEVAPPLGNRSWVMTAEVAEVNPQKGGVLVAEGTQNIGFSWYVKDERLVFDYNIFTNHHVLRSDAKIPEEVRKLGVRFQRKGAKGTVTLSIDGNDCGNMEVPFVLRMISSTGMDIGRDGLSPVTDDYKGSFAFNGIIRRLVVDLPKYRPPGEAKEDAAIKERTEMSRQ
jgi:arylsulfatase